MRDSIRLLEDECSRHAAEVRELRRIIAEQQAVLREQLQLLREAAGMDDPRDRDRAHAMH